MAKQKYVEKKNHKGPISHSESKKILELHMKGATYDDIVKCVGRSRSSVQRIIDEYRCVLKLAGDVSAYETARSNLLNAAEFKLIKSILKDERIDSATLRDLAAAFKTVYSSRRLEEDKSTSNTSTNTTFTKLDLTSERNDPLLVTDITNDTE